MVTFIQGTRVLHFYIEAFSLDCQIITIMIYN